MKARDREHDLHHQTLAGLRPSIGTATIAFPFASARYPPDSGAKSTTGDARPSTMSGARTPASRCSVSVPERRSAKAAPVDQGEDEERDAGRGRRERAHGPAADDEEHRRPEQRHARHRGVGRATVEGLP